MINEKGMDYQAREQARREMIRNLNLEDDIFFSEVLKKQEACRDMLRIILGRPELEIVSLTSQCSIRNIANRSLILDALASDGESHFNVEIQKSDNEDHIKRVRYHTGAIDTSTFDKGTKFHELKDLYIIFITRTDFLSLGKPVGIVERTIAGTGIEAGNGVTEIYANTEPHAHSEGSVYDLLQYIRNTDREHSRSEFSNLARCAGYLKYDEEGVKHMISILEKERQEGRQEGGQYKLIEQVNKKLSKGKTPEEIAEALEEPVEKIKEIILSLEQQRSKNKD